MEIITHSVETQDLVKLFRKQKAKSVLLRSQPLRERKEILIRFQHFLLQNRERINKAIHQDFKKPFVEVELSELYPVVKEIRNAVEHLDEWAAPAKIDAPITYLGTRSTVVCEPKGVCLIIAPWNFPFNLCFGPLISCLAAGNTAILKPSEITPHTSTLIVELVAEFFDEDRVAVITGGADVSTRLLELPFDHIFFTGSPAVGKVVMRAAAENLSSVTLELGGKSPTIVDQTANIPDAARRIAFGKFLNNGQTCIAPDYILVHESIREKFVGALRAKVLELFGEGGKIDETSPGYARIANDKNFQRLQSALKDALDRGATPDFAGPTNRETRFMHPMILSDVPAGAQIMEEEIFGPILPILTFSSLTEIITLINSKPKPLALYIFSADKKFQHQILDQTSAGSVCINDCIIQFTHPNLPFGGVNNSGIGKSHGRYGFLAFSNEKPIVRQKRGFAAMYMVHPPYTSGVKKMIDLMIKWF
jgi:aldehyde dehydrogenase (NAD+)